MTDIVTRYGLSTDQLTPPCNVTLYRDGTNTVLFDVGSGPDFMPSAGKITEAMDAIGLAPEEVTHVIFTHAHPDHIWGLLDEFDEPLFYEAAYHIGRQEWEYWTDPATVDTIGLLVWRGVANPRDNIAPPDAAWWEAEHVPAQITDAEPELGPHGKLLHDTTSDL